MAESTGKLYEIEKCFEWLEKAMKDLDEAAGYATQADNWDIRESAGKSGPMYCVASQLAALGELALGIQETVRKEMNELKYPRST